MDILQGRVRLSQSRDPLSAPYLMQPARIMHVDCAVVKPKYLTGRKTGTP